MKDYVLDHDWGSFDCEETVNKLMLRNEEDFIKYFNIIISEIFVAEVTNDYNVTLIDGNVHQVKIAKV